MKAEWYWNVIKSYVEGKIPISEFEKLYFNTYHDDPTFFPDDLFKILDAMYSYVEMYDSECTPEEETSTVISEDTLRKRAIEILEQLNEYMSANENEK